MKAVFLNCWIGKAGRPFLDFIATEAQTADILSLQEVNPKLLAKLEPSLEEFAGIYEKGGEYKGDEYGQIVLVKKPLKVVEHEKVFPYRKISKGYGDLGFLQKVEVGDIGLTLGNLQGKTLPGNKLDTKTRLRQSEVVVNEFKEARKKGPVIIGGDFNLLPETESIKKIEEAGYENLIKKFNIKNTRNKLAWDQFSKKKGRYFKKQYFADYVFVNDKVKVKDFKVPNNEVSDHLPMVLEFGL